MTRHEKIAKLEREIKQLEQMSEAYVCLLMYATALAFPLAILFLIFKSL